MPQLLRFGIPSLDSLFSESENKQSGIQLPHNNETRRPSNTSICINGPEGAGKSVLALHLASRYLADCANEKTPLPLVLYVSTDLKHEMAKRVWYKFGLNIPNKRHIPFSKNGIGNGDPDLSIPLEPCPPFQVEEENSEAKSLADYLIPEERKRSKPEVYFVDLASHTAGDDWGFVSRILSVVERQEPSAPHLMIIDSVEGFETLVGEIDAHGESQSRRSRIAQIMRSASDKWHIVFIVEEPDEKRHLPEEFVSDVVIHLHSILVRDYVRRSVEIVKARGQSHVRGQHTYLIRSGGGSTTGSRINPDDPQVSNGNEAANQSYLQVCPSLHYLNRKIMTDRGKGRPANTRREFAAFGIRYLDSMLDGKTDNFNRVGGNDERGLPCSTTTALIGNSQTQKSPLGIAFLCRCFRTYAEEFYRAIKALTNNPDKVRKALEKASTLSSGERSLSPIEEWRQVVYKRLKNTRGFIDGEIQERDGRYVTGEDIKQLSGEDRRKLLKETRNISDIVTAAAWIVGPPSHPRDGLPVLLTTQDVHAEQLAAKFLPWILRKVPDLKHMDKKKGFGCLAALRIMMEERIICRRLEIHDMPSAVLVHILQSSVETAQRLLFNGELPGNSEDRFERSWGIRVVIDDFSILRNTYVGIRDDPLLLRFLIFYLGREGVTTLLIDTQEGHPDLTVASHLDSELRSLVEHHIYTWRFPFFDGNRVAIAAIPSIRSQAPTIIRELRAGTGRGTGPEAAPLVVDPHFELYSGIEKGEPKPIPLEVRLFEEIPAFKTYITQLNRRCSDLFVPLHKDEEGNGRVITGIPAEDYEGLREFAYIQRDTRLDHTLVFHVDEFWKMKSPGIRRSGASHLQWDYLNAKTSVDKVSDFEDKPERIWAVDPFGWFQKTTLDQEEEAAINKNPRANQGGDRAPGDNDKEEENPHRRCHAFVSQGYTLMDESAKEIIDRVPFTWDFGFLLCRLHAWEDDRNKERELKVLQETGDKRTAAKYKHVGDVWRNMPKATKDMIPSNRERPSWRVFLEACYQLAREQTYSRSTIAPAFDLYISATPSLSCLILEIWASEIFNDTAGEKEKRKSLIDLVTKRDWHPTKNGLIQLISEYKLQLYKTWLLLVEVLDLQDLAETITRGSLRLREPNPATIAVRHWYKTACHFTENFSNDDPVIPVGLPGHFSVRGDWFLAVAGGSRSERLADQVLDFLNTQSANYERLQSGIGLPVRKLVTDKLRTSIITLDRGDIRKDEEVEHRRRVGKVLYENLIRLGGPVSNLTPTDGSSPGLDFEAREFYWFWRSGLANFFRHSKIWHDWLCQTILWWERMRKVHREAWMNGFKRYDHITREYPQDGERSEHLNIEAWNIFNERCDYLIKELKHATPL